MRKVLTFIFSILFCIQLGAQNQGELIQAVQSYAEEDFAKAKESLNRIHARDTTDDAVLYYLGMSELHSGDYGNAEKHLSEAIARDSANVWYINALASLFNNTGRSKEAAVLCEKLIRLAPHSYRNSYTFCLVADKNLRERKDSLAQHYYEMALEIDPYYAPAQIGLSEVMRITNNMPGYFRSIDSFMANESIRPEMKSDYMRALLENIDSRFYWVWGDQISRIIADCAKKYPDDIQARINNAQIFLIKGDQESMAKEYTDIIPLAREKKDTANLVMALATVGDYLYQKGNRKKAYSTYEEALKVQPDCAPVLNNYAYFLSEERKHLKKALAMSRIVIEQNPDNATYLDTFAWILHLLGRDKEAKPYFKHAMIYGGKESSVVLDHYSQVLRALKENDLADYYHNLSKQKER